MRRTTRSRPSLAREILNSALSGADLTRRLLAFARRQPLQPRRIDLNGTCRTTSSMLQRLLGEIDRHHHDAGGRSVADPRIPRRWATRCSTSPSTRATRCRMAELSIATANIHLEHGRTGWRGDGRGLRHAVGDRHRHRHAARGAGTRDRAVLHHKGARCRQRPWPEHDLGFARQSGGHLRIDSKLGHGTTVRVYLPRAEEIGPNEADEATGAPWPQGNESILLVDDKRKCARRRGATLSLGYRVSEAGSGQAALEVLRPATSSICCSPMW